MADRKTNRAEPSAAGVSPEGLNTEVVSAGLRTLLVASREESPLAKRTAPVDAAAAGTTVGVEVDVPDAEPRPQVARPESQKVDKYLNHKVQPQSSIRGLSWALGAADMALLIMLYVLVGRMEAQPSFLGWALITAGVGLAAWLGCLAAVQARAEKEREKGRTRQAE